ncbi:D-2-hydroxyacid dehydrogenase [Novosphingobium album (ex Liu et al. 2023)]|uniref:D-2-hydroxyacid dehydrogenase n=1 Tax=Novosphingobium album (ex Liu et al. 2023) TaxID=3031130 RepID=A0ABT5WXH8_9SPHN|nr:D-2-hydroxyacid dehydrogenase [Novosphingobium album (ex Liu et al. 2023)]MDE8654610.1 D-2-hydroxyacid dehydrogenase [Novosphingobium album (ex Liu et al. 2023)]
MISTLRLLVLNFPGQSEPFRITERNVLEALDRSPRGSLPLTVDVRLADDPNLAEAIAVADAILGPDFPRADIKARGKQLKLVQTTAAGIDHLLPLDWLPPAAAFATANGVHEGAKLTEWAMMVFLMLHTQMPHFITAQREHRWSRRLSASVKGKTALIYGTGAVGRSIAAGAERLGIERIGVRRSAGSVAGFSRILTMDEAHAFLPQADFVVLATPLTPETHNMMNRDVFTRMSPGAHFANFGRGRLVDQQALVEALESGHLGGAIVDVTTPEPPDPDSPFWDAPRLVITPHLSSDDPASHVPRVLDILIENLYRVIGGEPLKNSLQR